MCVQKEFVRLIQGSSVLVVLSPAWIEELYQQVLERNLLAEAGYWGWAEEQTAPPLVTMLRGDATDRSLQTSGQGSLTTSCSVLSLRHRQSRGRCRHRRSSDQEAFSPIGSQLGKDQQRRRPGWLVTKSLEGS